VSTGTAIAGTNVRNSGDDGTASISVKATEDTYTFAEFPEAEKGDAQKLVASSIPGNRKIAYLKFDVTKLPADATNVRATVRLTRDNHHLSAPVALSTVPDTTWRESSLNHNNAPELGRQLVEVPTGVSTRTVSFEIGNVVKSNGIYSFAVTSASTTAWASFRSTEYGKHAPTLLLEYETGGTSTAPTLAPSPSASPTPSAKPSASPSPTASAPAPPPPAPNPLPAGGTLCGASFLAEKPGETRAEQLARIDGYYNGLEMVRVFYTQPPAWSNVLNVGSRTLSISFKFAPRRHRRQVRRLHDELVQDRAPGQGHLLDLLPRARGQHRGRRVHRRGLPGRLDQAAQDGRHRGQPAPAVHPDPDELDRLRQVRPELA
jgi:hypothetical protein